MSFARKEIFETKQGDLLIIPHIAAVVGRKVFNFGESYVCVCESDREKLKEAIYNYYKPE